MERTVVGDLYVRQVDRLDLNIRLWTPARVASSRATADLELEVAGELGALSWHLYAPDPLGSVSEHVQQAVAELLAKAVH